MTEKKVVVVTGSSGRVGARVIARLPEQYQAIGMDFIGTTIPRADVEFMFVDLGSDYSVECAFNRIHKEYGGRIASIVHLAAYYSFTGKNLDLYEKITVQGTRRLLDQTKHCKVEQFLFTSTMLVHEPTARGVIQDETSPIKGKWHYPASKVRTEELIRATHSDVPTAIVRIAGCYDEECNCIPISQHISRIYERQLTSFLFPGNSSHGVPYTHFDDLIDMILLIIEKRATLPKESVFLCVEEDSMTYRELQTTFGQLLHGNKKWPMIWTPKFVAKMGAVVLNSLPFGPPQFIKPWMVDLADDNYEFTMAHAKKVLGWSPKRSLRATLPTIVKNMLKDPVAWYKRHGIPLSQYVLKHGKKESKCGGCGCGK
ncbi:MAG: NAD(P)-dependent oxidoreductase [Verrucomicrobia bacterium]|nr:NAD(P)-dependent oxidoreductase [Verrucomicrobiota bacterium]MBS0647446.1 NAD(P)-dependent oxidoreductase [Verrucomicrobiota bacterium]